jgi:spore maturation protein CgeB
MSLKISVLGSSLLSSYWNGAATYYRGIIRALDRLGCTTTFYEPDAFDRQSHRDIDPPSWAEVVVYPATAQAVQTVCREAARADIMIKASGVGVFDDELMRRTLVEGHPRLVRIFWDVDAPATLSAMEADPRHPLRAAVPQLDAVLTYGGGPPVVEAYDCFGARQCIPIYNALDPTTHHPVARDPNYACDLAFLGNRLPDREARVDRFFFEAARRLPDHRFILGGAGWESWQLPPNVRHIGHVPTQDHNAFNASPRAVINIARDSMAEVGFSPATRVFEAAGAGACLITDAWEGIDMFLEPDNEVLVARDGADVARLLSHLTSNQALAIGQAALHRVLRDHTYDKRARIVLRILEETLGKKVDGVCAGKVRA